MGGRIVMMRVPVSTCPQLRKFSSYCVPQPAKICDVLLRIYCLACRTINNYTKDIRVISKQPLLTSWYKQHKYWETKTCDMGSVLLTLPNILIPSFKTRMIIVASIKKNQRTDGYNHAVYNRLGIYNFMFWRNKGERKVKGVNGEEKWKRCINIWWRREKEIIWRKRTEITFSLFLIYFSNLFYPFANKK
jgi:hypothetical protein